MARHPLWYVFLVGFTSCLSGNTFATEERMTLMLSGSACIENRQVIEHALKQINGVRNVDLLAVPDHILVDIEKGAVTAEVLRGRANDVLTPQSSCRAEIMKSCISADPRTASAELP